MNKLQLIGYIALLSFSACDFAKTADLANSKTTESDPFKETIVESQYFDISTDKDTIIEGERGTILQIPKNSFIDENGNPVKGKVSIELAEPESLEDYLLSGINTQVNGKPFISQGSFFLKATHNGKNLRIDKENPIYVEKIKESEERGEVQILHGEKDANGLINWEEQKKAEKYLIAVALSELDFLPEGFREEVKKGMPFRSHKIATDSLIDSLYYSLYHQSSMLSPLSPEGDEVAFDTTMFTADTAVSESSILEQLTDLGDCGIDPASIKVIRSKRFEGSLIATREFEKRLRVIFQSCENELLELYVNNLDNNLWEIDSLAAEKLGSEHELYSKFKGFSNEKLTRVKENESSKELSKFYKKKLETIKNQLNKLRREAFDAAKKKDEIAESKRREYDKLLQEREKYRMDKFGFELIETGWYNGVIYVEDLEKFILEITVVNGDEFDRVHTYIVNNRIRSLFAMISDDQIFFNRGYQMDKYLLMWKNQEADAIVIAYKGEQAYFEKQRFTASPEVPAILEFNPEPVSDLNLKWKNRGDLFRIKENKISVDLEYQAFFAKERQRQQRLKDEATLIDRLKEKAFPCCIEDFPRESLE